MANRLSYQFNAVMPADTYLKCAEILHQLGGVKVVGSVVPATMETNRDLPHGVKFADCECRLKHLYSAIITDQLMHRFVLRHHVLGCRSGNLWKMDLGSSFQRTVEVQA